MDIDLILKVSGIGMIVAVVCQILAKAGREDQATLVSMAGIILILLLLAEQIGNLIGSIREVFGL